MTPSFTDVLFGVARNYFNYLGRFDFFRFGGWCRLLKEKLFFELFFNSFCFLHELLRKDNFSRFSCWSMLALRIFYSLIFFICFFFLFFLFFLLFLILLLEDCADLNHSHIIWVILGNHCIKRKCIASLFLILLRFWWVRRNRQREKIDTWEFIRSYRLISFPKNIDGLFWQFKFTFFTFCHLAAQLLNSTNLIDFL